MKPSPFTYHAPQNVNEVVDLLSRLENAALLAGGQSLMPMMNMRFAQPDHVVDISGLEDLSYIRVESGALHIGALTRQRDIERSEIVRRSCPLLHEAIRYVGHRQTRNRGTIGGSLCHMDPAAELVTVAAALDAHMTIAGPSGAREIPFQAFALDYMTTSLAVGELVTAVRLPLWPQASGFAFQEVARRHGDFAIASAAVQMHLDARGHIARVAIALGGVAGLPIRLREAESLLTGQEMTAALLSAAADCGASIDAMEDALVTAAYRQRLAKVLTRRALETAHGRSREAAAP
jgi:carbon-monoxide dehydrogenase medium subunit